MKKSLTRIVSACLAGVLAFGLYTTPSYAKEQTTQDIIATGTDAVESELEYASEEILTEETEDSESLEEETNAISDVVTQAEETIAVSVHQQTYGTLDAVSAGETAGKIGTNKRLEGFTITRTTQGEKCSGVIQYRAHCQSVGWQDWKTEGDYAGTSGLGKRLEAVQMQLSGDLAQNYDIYYRIYMSNCGWLDWAKNGQTAGTVGFAAVIEGMQVLLVKKDSGTVISQGRYASITADNLNTIYYSGHVQTYGDTITYTNGATCGTIGQAKRLEAIKIRLSHGINEIYGSVNYKVHCQTYGWMDTVTEGKLAGTTGEAKRLEAISITLTGDLAKYCNVYYRVHCQKRGWMGWAKNGENAGTEGNGYRMEAIEIRILPKGTAAPGSTQNAFSTERVISTTSGYSMLEPYLDSIIAQCTNESMTQEQKLRACFDWVRDHYIYKSIGADYPSNFKWHEFYAYQLVTTGYGNCYRFNSLFGHLALKLGYSDVVFYKGYAGGGPHGWVTINGAIYDPRYEHKYGGNFFGSTNGLTYIPESSSR